MHAPRASFWNTHRRTILALLFGLAFSAALAYAAPPGGGYGAGDTLNPDCAPGENDCIVQLPTYTFSTGLTNTSNTITSNLSTGVSGGQSVVGGTGAAQNLTLTSTSNAAKGTIIFGTSAYNEDTNQLGIGTTAPNTVLDIFTNPGVVAIQVTDGGDSFFTVNAVGGNILAIGTNAGFDATSATNANFIGFSAGNGATSATGSNFFGTNAGLSATSATSSNFIGNSPGVNATSASNSNFFGQDTGNAATDASFSNFLGYRAGFVATNASNSNFLGANAGFRATNASNSNFLGQDAGIRTTNASNSNFLGASAGRVDRISSGNVSDLGSINSANAIFIGANAGYFAADVNLDNTTDGNDYSILLGQNTSTGGFSNSIAIGSGAVNTGTNQLVYGSTTRKILSVFIGGDQGTASVSNTVFIGDGAGHDATGAGNGNFFGYTAGYNATNAGGSNFFGSGTGYGATNATESNFFGGNAGGSASSASYSNFFGSSSGTNATNANNSNFLGQFSGFSATNAANSNFFGAFAGQTATNASYASFIGSEAGRFATNASNAIFIGRRAGYANNTLNNTGSVNDYSILIGNYTTTAGFSNSIAIGTLATNTASNQFMIGSSTRPIDSTVFVGTAGTSCTITTGTSMSCSSDERLKTNIEDLETDTLDKLLSVRTVLYNWTSRPDADAMVGFLAQDLEQYFPQLVSTGPQDYLQVNYAGMTPILVEAIREINQKIVDIGDIEEENSWRDSLTAWLGNATNRITRIFTGEICLTDTDGTSECINKSELAQLKQLLGASATGGSDEDEEVYEPAPQEQQEEVEEDPTETPEIEGSSDSSAEPEVVDEESREEAVVDETGLETSSEESSDTEQVPTESFE